jgi:poly-gamma-glutamate synthesis protein (capsule biosynthesis protein)
MKKGTIIFGLIAATFVLVYFSPQELMQVSINGSTQEKVEQAENRIVGILKKQIAGGELGDKEPGTGNSVDGTPGGDWVNGDAANDDESCVADDNEPNANYFKSFMSQKRFYEEAYKGLEDSASFDKKVYAGILPHQLVFPENIAEYFVRLAKTEKIKTFVVIGPNHHNAGDYPISVSEYGFSTPYGNLDPDTGLIKELLKNDYLGFDASVFEKENSISSLVPFIKKSFPTSKIVAVTIKYGTSFDDVLKLIKDLNKLLGPDDFVLGSIDFSHYLYKTVADFHDELAENVIETFDFNSIDKLEIDSKPALYAVMKYSEALSAENADIINHTNSAESTDIEESITETTSHFYVAFEKDEKAESRDVTILAVGDMMMGRYVRILMDRFMDNEYPFEKIRGKEDRFFKGADIFFANLEGPIYKEGFSSETSMIFGFNEDTAPLLAKMGFSVLSIANNHILNQGWEGVSSTITALNNAGIGACGHPTEVSENNVVYKTIGDKKVAFFCFEDAIHPLDVDAAVSLISDVDSTVDFSIVSIHFGREYSHTPDWNLQIDPAHKFVDAGADFIIGHHPHVVQTFEIYNGVPIFYSLGNFIFDQYWSYDTQEQLGLGIVLGDGKTKVYLFPMKSADSQPYLLGGTEKAKFYERFIGWGKYDEDLSRQIRSSLIEITE